MRPKSVALDGDGHPLVAQDDDKRVPERPRRDRPVSVADAFLEAAARRFSSAPNSPPAAARRTATARRQSAPALGGVTTGLRHPFAGSQLGGSVAELDELSRGRRVEDDGMLSATARERSLALA